MRVEVRTQKKRKAMEVWCGISCTREQAAGRWEDDEWIRSHWLSTLETDIHLCSSYGKTFTEWCFSLKLNLNELYLKSSWKHNHLFGRTRKEKLGVIYLFVSMLHHLSNLFHKILYQSGFSFRVQARFFLLFDFHFFGCSFSLSRITRARAERDEKGQTYFFEIQTQREGERASKIALVMEKWSGRSEGGKENIFTAFWVYSALILGCLWELARCHRSQGVLTTLTKFDIIQIFLLSWKLFSVLRASFHIKNSE